MDKKDFAVKGIFIYSENSKTLNTEENKYLLIEDGLVKGFYDTVPENTYIYDFSNKIIIPGMYDLHVHASQFAYRGLGMDMELLDWLKENAFPEEAKFKDKAYAEKAYSIFTKELLKSPTTRAAIYTTVHSESTLILMENLEKSGLIAYVGKVNMDRDCPDFIRESTEKSLEDTVFFAEKSKGFKNVFPIITPRFIPTCTDELMYGLGKIRKDYNLPVQSHLSENLGEIELVKKLCPDSKFYADAYRNFGLWGDDFPVLMAHCVYSDSPEEIELFKKTNAFIAHCPQSNENIASGIAPIRKYIEEDLNIGLGTDVAGGAHLSMFRAITDTLQMSKLYWRLVDNTKKPLSFPEVFYLATEGGGKFFGKTGSFKEGYEFDAVILEDNNLNILRPFSPYERLQRLVYLSESGNIKGKFVKGVKVF